METIAAFEQKTGKDVEVVFQTPEEALDKTQAALEAGQPPDFLFGLVVDRGFDQWAYEDRLVDLTDAVGPLASLFDADALEASTLLNGRTGKRALYTLPMGRSTNHIHVWTSLLERAGFTLADIPKEWEAFWSFWCDRVQPAVRKAVGRDDIWGVGLPMSVEAGDTHVQITQFQNAYHAYWESADGEIQGRRSRRAGQPHQSPGSLYGRLPDGLRSARRHRLGEQGQQRRLRGADRGDDSKRDAVDPERDRGVAAGRLPPEHRNHRVAERCLRPSRWRSYGDLVSRGGVPD